MTAREQGSENLENRVLVFMPTGRDAFLVCTALESAGIFAQACANSDELDKRLEKGAGAVLIAEEALRDGILERVVELFNRQPVWSDLPIVIFAVNERNAEKILETVGTRLNATIVERPIRKTILISAVRGALRARQRQYEARDLLNKLEEADRQKDLFLATLSHELRTPLNSVLGWIQLLRGKSGQKIDTNYGLDVIERNAKAQAEMISDILFVSRVITGKLTLNLETVDLIQIVQSAIDVVRPSVEAKEIQLKTFFDSKVNQIRGDRDRLQQIFWNLLSNAVKFTPNKGQIEIRVTDNNSNIEIEVCDSGKGINPEFLPFVFERFRQADSSYTRQVGGLGLGLAIVRHLVELHGGSVGVKSDGEGSGATFIVVLPAFAQQNLPHNGGQNQDKSSAPFEMENSLKGVRVLMVEDDEDSREMLREMFRHYEMEIVAVDSAAEALKSIEKFQPEILISDVGLPGEDGYDLIRKVRQLAPEQGGQVPAVALTGYASLQDRDRALDFGFQEHLPKPVDLEKLIELIKKLIARKNP